ncbi:MAG: acetate kinase [Christensenellaceae bacterium]|jgi:acetate kinase|nr:acetate kinase [Christensenellaceae bacterium]
MNVLVFNSGSSSLKYQLIDTASKKVILKGEVDRIGTPAKDAPRDHSVAMSMVFEKLGTQKVDAIGHRVVHGGPNFSSATLVTAETLKQVESISHLAPLHNPAAMLGVRACRDLMPKIPNVMVFDTAFHATMPEKAYLYALPLEDCKKHNIRRYGAHGTSHDYVSQKVAEMCKKPREKLKIIVCHIGNGASVCAIDKGKSVETSMGLTPLEGLVMGTRSGDIDPAAVEYLAKAHNFTLPQTITYLNKQCGLLGLTGKTSDFRDLLAMYDKGDQTVATAFDVFFHRIVKYIGAYVAVMNGVDVIAFTAGIGNNIPALRQAVIDRLGFLGIKIDPKRNAFHNCNSVTGEITGKGSRARIFAIKTEEELSIATQVEKILSVKC